VRIEIRVKNEDQAARVIRALAGKKDRVDIQESQRTREQVGIVVPHRIEDSMKRSVLWRIDRYDADLAHPKFALPKVEIAIQARMLRDMHGPFDIHAAAVGLPADDLLREMCRGLGGVKKAGVQKYANRRRLEDDRDYDAFAAAVKAYDVSEFPGNIGLNSGIQQYEELLAGISAPTAWNNANARTGTGTSSTAAAATDTALLGAPVLVGMVGGFPSRSTQALSWQGSFTALVANQAWNEFGVDNGAGQAYMLNRKVSAQGTKTSGQTWTLTLTITWS
jgi:hypothetical protein